MAPPTSLSNSLGLNFFEAVFTNPCASVWSAGYDQALFEHYRADPAFYVYRFDDQLYVWPTAGDAAPTSQYLHEAEITLTSHAPIFAKMLEQALVTYLRGRAYGLRFQRHSNIWEADIRRETVGDFGALQLQPKMCMSFHTLSSQQHTGTPLVGLSVRKRYRPRFVADEDRIQAELTDTRDLHRNHAGAVVASSHNVSRYLEATGQSDRFYQFKKDRENDHQIHQFLSQISNTLCQMAPKLYFPGTLSVDKFLLNNLPNSHFEPASIQKPTYYYYNERTKPGYYYNKALEEVRPYSYDRFRGVKVRIAAITPPQYEGTLGEYIPTLRAQLNQMFHLDDVDIDLHTCGPDQTYSGVIDQVDIATYNLAVIVVSEKDKNLDPSESPYYLTKSKCLNQRVPTQEITIETLRTANFATRNNVALNVYAKLGGTPWTVDKLDKNITELIVGVGAAEDTNGQWTLGFANVFDHNGTYIVGSCNYMSSGGDYLRDFERHVTTILRDALAKKAISPDDEIRLIFHLFKEAGRHTEIQAIDAAVRKFSEYEIQKAILHLSYEHNFRLYYNEGQSAPPRGLFVQISSRQALLHFGGHSATPVQVRLDRRSDYHDLYAMSRQVLFFSHLSYRTFKPPKQPVTIKYPKLMAQLINKLEQLPNWDVAMAGKLNEKLWFI